MTTDSLFYRLVETSPETFFLALGMSAAEAQAKAAKYQYLAVEVKETSHRTDGVFQPKTPGLPIYFVELQFYRLAAVYADILVKAYSYLKRNDPADEFFAVVLFSNRSYEPSGLKAYEPLLQSGHLRRIFVDELPDAPNAPLGLSILRLIGMQPEPATETAKALLRRTKAEISDPPLRDSLLQLIETVVIYKLPRLSREEIQAMLEVSDIRETKVFQEGREEGREEERTRALRDKLDALPELRSAGFSVEKIAHVLKLDIALVKAELEKHKS